MTREENFFKNLNYLKDNKGFTVPFFAEETKVNLRTMEKYFSGENFPKKHLDSILNYIKDAYNLTESDLLGPPNKNIGKVITSLDSKDKSKQELIDDIISRLPLLEINHLGVLHEDIFRATKGAVLGTVKNIKKPFNT